MSVIKIAGKSPTNTVKSVNVTADGDVKTSKTWDNEILTLRDLDTTPSVSSGFSFMTFYNIEDGGAVSLRIVTTLNVPVTINFYSDWSTNNYQLRDADGILIQKTIGKGSKNIIITPDDIPQLMWLRKIKVGYKLNADEGDTITGTLKAWAIVKR